jgi:hypothetical protein
VQAPAVARGGGQGEAGEGPRPPATGTDADTNTNTDTNTDIDTGSDNDMLAYSCLLHNMLCYAMLCKNVYDIKSAWCSLCEVWTFL